MLRNTDSVLALLLRPVRPRVCFGMLAAGFLLDDKCAHVRALPTDDLAALVPAPTVQFAIYMLN